MIEAKDIAVDGSDDKQSLVKLIGKDVLDIRGYLSNELSDVSFKLTEIVFKDGTLMGVEGEHDFPYVVNNAEPQPNFDDETLERLYGVD